MPSPRKFSIFFELYIYMLFSMYLYFLYPKKIHFKILESMALGARVEFCKKNQKTQSFLKVFNITSPSNSSVKFLLLPSLTFPFSPPFPLKIPPLASPGYFVRGCEGG